jgi:hypothetical protein
MRLTHPICIQGAKKEGRKSLPAHASLQQYKQHLTWLIVVPLIASGTAQIGAGGKYCLVASQADAADGAVIAQAVLWFGSVIAGGDDRQNPE